MNLPVRSHTDRRSQWRAFSYSMYQWLESDSTWNRTSSSWRRGLLSNYEGGSILKRPFVQEILGSWKHIYQSKETFSWSNYGFILVFTEAAWRPVNVDTVALMAFLAIKVQLNEIFVIECWLPLMQPFLSHYMSCKVHGGLAGVSISQPAGPHAAQGSYERVSLRNRKLIRNIMRYIYSSSVTWLWRLWVIVLLCQGDPEKSKGWTHLHEPICTQDLKTLTFPLESKPELEQRPKEPLCMSCNRCGFAHTQNLVWKLNCESEMASCLGTICSSQNPNASFPVGEVAPQLKEGHYRDIIPAAWWASLEVPSVRIFIS